MDIALVVSQRSINTTRTVVSCIVLTRVMPATRHARHASVTHTDVTMTRLTRSCLPCGFIVFSVLSFVPCIFLLPCLFCVCFAVLYRVIQRAEPMQPDHQPNRLLPALLAFSHYAAIHFSLSHLAMTLPSGIGAAVGRVPCTAFLAFVL